MEKKWNLNREIRELTILSKDSLDQSCSPCFPSTKAIESLSSVTRASARVGEMGTISDEARGVCSCFRRFRCEDESPFVTESASSVAFLSPGLMLTLFEGPLRIVFVKIHSRCTHVLQVVGYRYLRHVQCLLPHTWYKEVTSWLPQHPPITRNTCNMIIFWASPHRQSVSSLIWHAQWLSEHKLQVILAWEWPWHDLLFSSDPRMIHGTTSKVCKFWNYECASRIGILKCVSQRTSRIFA